MLGTILRGGACAAGLLILAGITGCQPQNGSSNSAMSGDVAGSTAMVNQGRFPAPIYSQDVQPSYALTGNAGAQDEWASRGNYYQAGNARITFPAAP
jgi:hypothetical protein